MLSIYLLANTLLEDLEDRQADFPYEDIEYNNKLQKTQIELSSVFTYQ